MATFQEKQHNRSVIATLFINQWKKDNSLTPAAFAKQEKLPETSVYRAINEHYPSYLEQKQQEQSDFVARCQKVIAYLKAHGPKNTCDKFDTDTNTLSKYIQYHNKHHNEHITQGSITQNLILTMYLEKGLKIGEIAKALQIQKSTASHHLNSKKLPQKIKDRISEKRSSNANNRSSIQENRNLSVEAAQAASLFFDMFAEKHKGYRFKKSSNLANNDFLVTSPSGDLILIKIKATGRDTGSRRRRDGSPHLPNSRP